MKRFSIIINLILAFLFLLNPIQASAKATINVIENQVVNDFPDKLIFSLSVRSTEKIEGIKLLYHTNATSCTSAVAQQEIDITPGLEVQAEWVWDFTLAGILPPGAEIYWQWQITDATGESQLTDEQTYPMNDPRHYWKQKYNIPVHVFWYEGSDSFGQSLIDIATNSLDRLANDAGVQPSGQFWITIYPTVEELLEVDIHASEWAGGIAYTEYNSTIMAIGPSELSWAASVIPHELAHMVTEAEVFNCMGMWLPTWLSEGIAIYAEGDITQYYIDVVNNALEEDALPPLRTLERGFSSVSEEANLSYAHSGMVVTYLIDHYGAEKMTDLLAAIQAGNMIDKALLAVYGKDTDGLEAEWRISLGFAPQPTQAPTSAVRTAVPTLALWTSAVRPSATAKNTPTPTATMIPPTYTPIAQPSATVPVVPDTPTTDAPDTSTGMSAGIILTIVIAAVVVFAAGVIILIIVNKRRRTSL